MRNFVNSVKYANHYGKGYIRVALIGAISGVLLALCI